MDIQIHRFLTVDGDTPVGIVLDLGWPLGAA
jgi:hypothetical protein